MKVINKVIKYTYEDDGVKSEAEIETKKNVDILTIAKDLFQIHGTKLTGIWLDSYTMEDE